MVEREPPPPKDYTEILKSHLGLIKKNRGTIARCAGISSLPLPCTCSITMRNKVAERRVSTANELVQWIIDWKIYKLK